MTNRSTEAQITEYLQEVVERFSPRNHPTLKAALDELSPEDRDTIADGTEAALKGMALLADHVLVHVSLSIPPRDELRRPAGKVMSRFTDALGEMGSVIELNEGVTAAVARVWGNRRHKAFRRELDNCKYRLIGTVLGRFTAPFDSRAWVEELRT